MIAFRRPGGRRSGLWRHGVVVAAGVFLAIPSPAAADSSSVPAHGSCYSAASRPIADNHGSPAEDEAAKAQQESSPPDTKATQDDSGTAEPGSDRLFGVLPNYTTVEHTTVAAPADTRDKFRMAALNTFDPYVYLFVGGVAMINHNYGPGVTGFLKQYPASLADNAIGNYFTTAILPSAFCQDPRYYTRGSGSFWGRAGYAASRIFVTRTDTGHAEFNFSEIAGNGIAAGISNLYYPRANRTATDTLTRWGMQVMWDTLSNELKEFWPDVRRKLHHH